MFVRDGRIELPSSVWKTDVLPLNESRVTLLYTKLELHTKTRALAGFCALVRGVLLDCIFESLRSTELRYFH